MDDVGIMSDDARLRKVREYLPEGWVIVPIEPTQIQLDTADDLIDKKICTVGDIYKAMINEAQK